MGRQNKIKQKVYMIIIPGIFTIIFAIIWIVGFKGLTAKMSAEFKAVWVKGNIKYSFEELTDMNKLADKGVISSGKIVFPKAGDMYGKIICEDIDMNVPLYYGDSYEILENGAGTYIGECLPGEGGTILIGGHDTCYFATLEKIEQNDMIKVITTYGKFEYKVIKIDIKEVTDSVVYKTDESEEMLVLYTCYPFGEADKQREKRFYVYAQKVTGPVIGEDKDE